MTGGAKRPKEKPRPDRMPDPELVKGVETLFELVSQVDSNLVKIGRRSEPSIVEARRVLGFQSSNQTAWAQGRARALPFTHALLETLRGDFWRIEDNGKHADALAVWEAFTPPPGFIGRLTALAQAHLEKLQEADKRASEARAIRLGKGTALTSPAWAHAWLRREIGGWADRLLSQDDRVVYIYGARKSGKSALIEALCEHLEAAPAEPTILRLNVSALLSRFGAHRDACKVKEAILNGLLHHLRPDAEPVVATDETNFDAEMRRVLSHASDGPIYLVISNSDACLRLADTVLVSEAIEATKPLFGFLAPVPDENLDPLLSRISIVLEGSRPLKDLCRRYPASPLNKATNHILSRLKPDDVADRARAARISEAETLMHRTGGHRSLLWAMLRTMRTGRRPDDLSTLPNIRQVIDTLLEELAIQPQLAEALADARRGEEIDVDEASRLQHCMYLAPSRPLAVNCPLLEAALDENPLVPGRAA